MTDISSSLYFKVLTPLTETNVGSLTSNAYRIKGLQDIFYRNNEPLQNLTVGDQFQNEPLARTFELIRDDKNAFHTLPLAEDIG